MATTATEPVDPEVLRKFHFTREMVEQKIVTARLKGDVTYGRFVGELYRDGRSLNRELVRAGLAWWNKSYERYDLDYQRLEADARTRRVGLWSQSAPVPPWKWRRGTGH